jgi:methylated-DNA-protein-cysteine methyltransferase related protein
VECGSSAPAFHPPSLAIHRSAAALLSPASIWPHELQPLAIGNCDAIREKAHHRSAKASVVFLPHSLAHSPFPRGPYLFNTGPREESLAAFCSYFYDEIRGTEDATRLSQGGLRLTWDPVYRLVKQIPRGRVTTYGALAKVLRLRGGARTAGRAMAATPSGRGIPWHRVVGDRGKLLIREPYASLQRKLLESEGISLLESRVDLALHGWTPKKPAAPQVKHKTAAARSAKRRSR